MTRAPRARVVAAGLLILALLTGIPGELDAQERSFDAAMQAGTRAMASRRPAVALEAFREAVSLRPEHPVARAFLGAALLELGRIEEATRELERALDTAPSLYVAQYHLGLAHLEAGDPAAAVAPLRAAHEQRPEEVGARLMLARALLEAGDPEAALSHLQSVVGQHPETLPAWQYLGQTLLRLDRYEEGLEALREAEELEPGHPVTLYGKARALARLGRYEEATDSLEQVVAADPERADAWLLLGQILQVAAWQATDLQPAVRAAEALERALELRPGHRETLTALAEVYRRLGLYEEVLAILDELEAGSGEERDARRGEADAEARQESDAGVEGDVDAGALDEADATSLEEVDIGAADEAELLVLRGRILSLLGRYQEARGVLREATDLGAGALAWYGLGVVHQNLSDVDAALDAFGRAVELQPAFAAAWRERGDLLIDRQRYAEAREALQAAVEGNPRDAEAWYLLGLAHLREGDAAAALSPLRRALELDPELARAAYNLATALRMAGRTEESAAMMERFQELDAEQGDRVSGLERSRAQIAALNRQGLYYYQRGEPDRAIERFRRALALGPKNEVVHFNLGLAHVALDNWEAAAAAFEEARDRKPDRPDVWAALAQVYRALGRTEDADRAQARYEELRRR